MKSSRRSRRFFALGVMAFAFVGGWFWWTHTPLGSASTAIDEEVARLQRMGLPTTPNELRALAKSGGTNAAPYYLDAIKESRGKHKMSFGVLIRLREAAYAGVLTPKDRIDVSDALKEMAPVFARIEQGSRCDRLDYHRRYEDGLFMLLPDLAQMRALTNETALAGLEAIRRGDVKLGERWLLTAARVTRQLADDPGMIETVVRCQAEGETVRAMLCAFQARPDDPRMVTLARDVLKALGPPIDLRPGTATECVIVRGTANHFARLGADKFFMDFGLKASDLDSYTLPLLKTHAVRLANEATLLRYWRIYRENLPADPEDIEAVRKAGSLAVAAIASQPSFSRLVWDRIAMLTDGGSEFVGNALTARRVLASTTDAFEIRQRTGSFPASLKAVADDPFVVAPLHYTGSGGHLKVYSVGANHVDDGGKVGPAGNTTSADFGAEFQFRK